MERFATALSALLLLGAAAPVPRYSVEGSIAGTDGGWDYAQVDPATRTLFVAHDGAVMVVDLATRAARTIGSVMRAHAVVPLPGGLVLVTSGRDDSVRLVSVDDGQEAAKIGVDKDPDAALYDAKSGRAIVVNAKAGTVSVIDVAARRVTATITLKPGLEYAQLGPDGTLYVNNEDENEVETADLSSGKPGILIEMPGCEGPTGLAYDAKTAQLISACGNGKAVVIDARSNKVRASIDIGKGADAVILDPQRRVALIPCGRDGVLELLKLDGEVAHIGSIRTEIGARTGALDPKTGTIYLPTARFAPPAAAGGRPQAIPGSFHVLVVKPGSRQEGHQG